MSEFFFEPGSLASFHPGKASKTDVVRGESLFLGLNCFEPGQSQSVHVHPDADKFYLVLSGRASIRVGAEVRDVGTGALVWAPADIPHGVETAHERTVILIGMSPPPGTRSTG